MKISKILMILLCITVIMPMLIGCNDKNCVNENVRIIQKEMNLPTVNNILDVKQTKIDGSLTILSLSNNNNFTIYTNEGQSGVWLEKKFTLPNDNIDNKYVINATMNNEQEVAIVYSDTKKIDEINATNTHAAIVNSDNNITQLKLTDKQKLGISKIEFTYNGDILCLSDNELSLFDGKTGKFKYNIGSENGGIMDFAVNTSKIIVSTRNSVIEYNLTAKKIGVLDNFNKYRTTNFKLYSNKLYNTVYFSNTNGLYIYDLGSKKINKIIDGKTSSFGNSNSIPLFIIKNSSKNYSVIQYNADKTFKRINYTYTKVDKSHEIVLYSLHKSDDIGQAISQYQDKNSDVIIDYEVGISDDSQITESDAIKTLNTEIMAGEGPDIIIMDGLPMNEFIQKGVLDDISDIIETKKTNLFKNITDSYLKDKKTYIFPLKFQLPVITGEEQNINGINDIDSLTTKIQELYDKDGGKTLAIFEPEDIFNLLYNTSEGTWINKDSTCNKEIIKKYLEDCKKIYSITQKPLKADDYKYINDLLATATLDRYQISINRNFNRDFNPSRLLKTNKNSDEFKLDVGNICSLTHLTDIVPAIHYNKSIMYKTFSAQDNSVFIPCEIIALNSKSSKKDLSKKFISSLFDVNAQKIDNYEGIPTNKAAVTDYLRSHPEGYSSGTTKLGDGDGNSIEYDNTWITELEINNFLTQIESVKNPSKCDTKNLYKMSKLAAKYISGDGSLDDTVDSIVNIMKLSSSEK